MASLCESQLERNEPRFYSYWISHVDRSDPQHERWVELEGEQLAEGRRAVETVSRFFDVEGRDVLDIGCQWGATAIAFGRAGAHPAGIDIEDDLIEGAQLRAEEQRVPIDVRKGLAEAIPYPDQSFDVVTMRNVIEHVQSHRQTIRELLRVLRPGGGLWLIAPNRLSPQLLRCDPHYSMAGISILPSKLGELYVTGVRRYPSWTVGTFPVASRLERMIVNEGAEIIGSSRIDAATRTARERRLNKINSTALYNLRREFYIAARKSPAQQVPRTSR
jgi:2-polyprenyl-3-methyl-5-hydroxy-6-metoxy-1,4-benzoquinol methylase